MLTVRLNYDIDIFTVRLTIAISRPKPSHRSAPRGTRPSARPFATSWPSVANVTKVTKVMDLEKLSLLSLDPVHTFKDFRANTSPTEWPKRWACSGSGKTRTFRENSSIYGISLIIKSSFSAEKEIPASSRSSIRRFWLVALT